MAIYRIQHNDQYMIYQISTTEVLKKLGREYPFHIDRSPIKYAAVWSEPLNITFAIIDGDENTSKRPDMSEDDGRLFLSSKAHNELHRLLENDGEFLPVSYEGGEGVMFNPLTIAEDLDALNEDLIGHDQHGHLEHFEFIEDKLKDTVIFRAKIDHYHGLFCGDALKNAIESAGLEGVCFQPDLANFTCEPNVHTQ